MNRGKGGGLFQPQTLDIDESIFDRNLMIVPGAQDDAAAASPFFTGAPPAASSQPRRATLLPPDPACPILEVTPVSGFCVKTKNLSGEKVFLNVCRIGEIPPAKPISEEQLQKLIAEEDYSSDYRVPMSLGAPRSEKDKNGGACLCSDVALNSAWYEDTMENSITFTTFVVHIAMEGLCEKYGDQVNLDRQNWSILKNKKYMGKLQRHSIQQRAAGNKIKEVGGNSSGAATKSSRPLVTEIQTTVTKGRSSPVKMETEMKMSSPSGRRPEEKKKGGATHEICPKYKLFKVPAMSESPHTLVAEIQVPGVRTRREMTLDVGEDRIVFEARKVGYLLDIFVPFSVDLEKTQCQAKFHQEEQTIKISLPLL